MGWITPVALSGVLLAVTAGSFAAMTWYLDSGVKQPPPKAATALDTMERASDLLRCQLENPIAPGAKPAQRCVDIATALLQITQTVPPAAYRGHGKDKFEIFVTELNVVAIRRNCSDADVAVKRFEWVSTPVDPKLLPPERHQYGNIGGYVEFDTQGFRADSACLFAFNLPQNMPVKDVIVSQWDATPGKYSWRLGLRI